MVTEDIRLTCGGMLRYFGFWIVGSGLEGVLRGVWLFRLLVGLRGFGLNGLRTCGMCWHLKLHLDSFGLACRTIPNAPGTYYIGH